MKFLILGVKMSILIILCALALLMYVAYRGHSVIIFAPLICMGAVFVTNPSALAPAFNNIFLESLINFVKNYFPVFLLGAIFGKMIEVSGFARVIALNIIRFTGEKQAILAIVLSCGALTYGGVSLFIVIFAVYPFAVEIFKQAQIPKRFIPASVVLGAFTFTMDAFPGSPQIQNIIPTTFFGTTAFAGPFLGLIGGCFILVMGILYINYRVKVAKARGEGYGTNHINEPDHIDHSSKIHPIIAILPLVSVFVFNFIFTKMIPLWYGSTYSITLAGLKAPIEVTISKISSIWAIEAALIVGILIVLIFAFKKVTLSFISSSKHAVNGAILAALSVGSEYGFGAVIAALPGFVLVTEHLKIIGNPLLNQAISINILAGITGSSSGGMSIALGAMKDQFIQAALAANIPMEVLHRVSAMAAGGMDTLPHSGAVITVLTVTGLTHKQSYKDIFAITLIKTFAAFFVIGLYYTFGIV